ncbi:hypothetical protein [Brevibacillus choshinensis]|uniref:Integrase n=1 Tax=Brevibacillus choshinensis TaxID=54911 RepID=A0ABX7FHD6_BRECH|nr:hypothetical protein [Brevibacillus choshinensis]QRG65567.1 hypothetical protein JNE38_18310 [Brevibacillus choshinensis]
MIRYTNSRGRTVEFHDNNTWVSYYGPNGSRPRTFTFVFDIIPVSWRAKVMQILRSTFDKTTPSNTYNVYNSFRLFFSWLDQIGNPSFDSFDQVDDIFWGAFDDWLEVTRKCIISTRRAIFYSLKTGIKESIDLELQIATGVSIYHLEDIMLTRFRKVKQQMMLQLNEKVLTTSECEIIYAVIAQQYHEAQKVIVAPIGELPPGFKRKERTGRYAKVPGKLLERQVDMLAVTAIWLGLTHGMRPEEFATCTLDDIIVDPLGANHKMYCHAANKPSRYIPIPQLTLDIINLFIRFTERCRRQLETDLLCVDWDNAGLPKKVSLAHHLKRFVHNFDIKDDNGKPLPVNMKNLRRTFGSQIASYTNNPELARRIMGHAYISTTKEHYTLQRLSELSHNVSKGLRLFALQITMSYKSPIIDIDAERPDIAESLKNSPDRDHEFGICTVPQTTDELANSCARARHCFECEFLVVETKKRENFVLEKKLYLQLAENEADERIKQQKLRRAQQAEAWIVLIDQKIEKHFDSKEKIQIMDKENRSRRKRTYYRK